MLPSKNLIPIVVSGVIFTLLASGRYSYAGAAFIAPVPLLVLLRASSLAVSLPVAFLVLFVARLLAWSGDVLPTVSGADFVLAVAQASLLSLLPLLCYRWAFTFLPRLGALAFPAAVVVLEALATSLGMPFATPWALWMGQAGNGALMAMADILSSSGVSFCVAWAAAVMAGFGEAHIAPDVWPQDVRERGVRFSANLCFFVLVVGLLGGGLLRGREGVLVGSHGDSVVVACAVLLLALLTAALVVGRRLAAQPTPSAAPG